MSITDKANDSLPPSAGYLTRITVRRNEFGSSDRFVGVGFVTPHYPEEAIRELELCFDTLDISDAGIEALLALAYTVVFAFIFAYYAWFTVLDLFPASVASIGTLLVPIAGMASGWLILAEAITLFDLIAGALVVVGVALAMSER